MPEYYLYSKKIRSSVKNENIPYVTFKKTATCMVSALALSLTLATTAHAASQTIKYTYDTLGRVTFVEDPSNSSRDYDYDPAGNRTLVAIGNNSDDDADGGLGGVEVLALVAPTGLTIGGPYSMYGGYDCSWGAVPGAISYQVGLDDGSVLNISGKTRADSPGPRPKWVRAVDIYGNGPAAYF